MIVFKTIFCNNNFVHIPEVYDNFSTKRLLTMGWLDGSHLLEIKNRKLSERRIFPNIDIARSSTRREDLLLDEVTLKHVWLLRRMVAIIDQDSHNPSESVEKLLERLAKTKSNKDFLSSLSRGEM